MSKHKFEQRFSVALKIGTPVRIPWMSKKGVKLELADGDEGIAEIRITGAQIHIRRAAKKKWISFTFTEFLDRLVT